MQNLKYAFTVEAQLELTKKELGILLECSKHHYDGHCQSMSRQGGILYGMRNMLDMEEEGVTRRFCAFREIDSMVKCLEIAPLVFRPTPEKAEEAGRLFYDLKQLLKGINDETARVNSEEV